VIEGLGWVELEATYVRSSKNHHRELEYRGFAYIDSHGEFEVAEPCEQIFDALKLKELDGYENRPSYRKLAIVRVANVSDVKTSLGYYESADVVWELRI
jgi:hypothetical protein